MGWGGVADDLLDEFVGLGGGLLFAGFALADGFGDGCEHGCGVVASGAACWVFLAFEVFLEVSGGDVTGYVFFVYLCGGFVVAFADLVFEAVADGLVYHFFGCFLVLWLWLVFLCCHVRFWGG